MENPYELAYEILVDDSDWIYERFNGAILDYIRSLLDGFTIKTIDVFGPPEENKTSLPTDSGVYIFYDDYAGLKIVYVGQAKNIMKRLTTHHHVNGYPVVCVSLPAEEMTAAEKLLIRHFSPPINIKLKTTTIPTETAFNLGRYIGRKTSDYAELPY